MVRDGKMDYERGMTHVVRGMAILPSLTISYHLLPSYFSYRPVGRGCYVSGDGGFIIWVGEEERRRASNPRPLQHHRA